MTCTRCDNTGFLNVDQIPEADLKEIQDDPEGMKVGFDKWKENNLFSDAQICDCCGDGENWYGEPGEHYKTPEDQPGMGGPYAYNGGLPECS